MYLKFQFEIFCFMELHRKSQNATRALIHMQDLSFILTELKNVS